MDDLSKSRTQLKKEDKALQKLGESLVALSPDRIVDIEMPQELREAVDLARKTRSHGARRRQLKYIGKLMRGIDCGPIRQAIQNLQAGDLEKIRAHKKIEGWRDALKAGNLQTIEDILDACPQAERQRLTQLARNAHAHADSDKAVTSSRQLFRYLKEISVR
jgi:ribosome-associated protein